MVYPALLPLMPHTSAASSPLNWRPPADLNGLVRFARQTKCGSCACAITFQLQSTARSLIITELSHLGFSFFPWRCGPTRAMASFLRFLCHTQRRITFGRTPLDEWSARRIDLYLTTHNTHNKHPCIRWDSNPQSKQASGLRPTPTATVTGVPSRFSEQN